VTMKTKYFVLIQLLALLIPVGCKTSPTPSLPHPITPQLTPSASSLSPTPLPTSSLTSPPRPTPTKATPTSSPTPRPTPSPTFTRLPTMPPVEPFDLISQDSLFATIADLTAIQPYSGWRTSASQGEKEALDYLEEALGQFAFLRGLGLELQRESFHVFLGTELWETRLHLVVDGQAVEVPADGLQGHGDGIAQSLRADSDGQLNDATRNPVVVEGPAVLVRSAEELDALSAADLAGKVVLLDYAAIDGVVLGWQPAVQVAARLVAKQPAGLVLVTQFSDQAGESHGAFVGGGSVLNWVATGPAVPTLYARLEDLGPAGVEGRDDLLARIPGTDPRQAVILGAHIDSPNSPGAMDDGSGSAVLLEVARVLDAAGSQPATDLYLVWFGSEELGLYGSSHFVATHQALLDRTLAMLQIDCLTHPLDGISADLVLTTWPYGRLGDPRATWPNYLSQVAARRGVQTVAAADYDIHSDNNSFGGFDVPHAYLIYVNREAMAEVGGVHFAAHIHDPYDTIDLAREVGDVLEQMAHVALAAALDTAQETPNLRVTPPSYRRALFVASHTEAVHMTPSHLTDLGMALAMAGFDVDLVPYGQAVTPADLAGVDLAVALPVVDYPSPDGDPDLYDEAWSEKEIAALEAYVAGGGLLVLTNSRHRLVYLNRTMEANEDWPDANPLAERFGITYQDGALLGTKARTEGGSPLVEQIGVLEIAGGNGLPFSLSEGQVLARMDGEPVVALVDYGTQGGQVLVLADVGILGAVWGEPANLPFWQNLARYARSR
jgi:hypothetical protein